MRKKCDLTVALLKWANVQKKCKIWNCTFFALLKERSHNCSFEKGECAKMFKKGQSHIFKTGDCPTLLVEQFVYLIFALFLHISSLKKCYCVITLLDPSFKKCDCAIALFDRSFKKCHCAVALFFTFQKCYCAITLFLLFQKCDCTIALLKWGNVWKCAK